MCLDNEFGSKIWFIIQPKRLGHRDITLGLGIESIQEKCREIRTMLFLIIEESIWERRKMKPSREL